MDRTVVNVSCSMTLGVTRAKLTKELDEDLFNEGKLEDEVIGA